jgi:hypothetical protein
MACGTGKMRVLLGVIVGSNSPITLVVFPLVAQLEEFRMDRFFEQGTTPISAFNITYVTCGWAVKAAMTAMPTTGVADTKRSVFCVTYALLGTLVDAMRAKHLRPDLLLFYDAHHCVAERTLAVIREQMVGISALFFTATPTQQMLDAVDIFGEVLYALAPRRTSAKPLSSLMTERRAFGAESSAAPRQTSNGPMGGLLWTNTAYGQADAGANDMMSSSRTYSSIAASTTSTGRPLEPPTVSANASLTTAEVAEMIQRPCRATNEYERRPVLYSDEDSVFYSIENTNELEMLSEMASKMLAVMPAAEKARNCELREAAYVRLLELRALRESTAGGSSIPTLQWCIDIPASMRRQLNFTVVFPGHADHDDTRGRQGLIADCEIWRHFSHRHRQSEYQDSPRCVRPAEVSPAEWENASDITRRLSFILYGSSQRTCPAIMDDSGGDAMSPRIRALMQNGRHENFYIPEFQQETIANLGPSTVPAGDDHVSGAVCWEDTTTNRLSGAEMPAIPADAINPSDACPMCLEHTLHAVVLPCRHCFCHTCLLVYLDAGDHRCALCRASLTTAEVAETRRVCRATRDALLCHQTMAVTTADATSRHERRLLHSHTCVYVSRCTNTNKLESMLRMLTH